MAMDPIRRALRLKARIERINFCLDRGDKGRIKELKKELELRQAELAYLALKNG